MGWERQDYSIQDTDSPSSSSSSQSSVSSSSSLFQICILLVFAKLYNNNNTLHYGLSRPPVPCCLHFLSVQSNSSYFFLSTVLYLTPHECPPCQRISRYKPSKGPHQPPFQVNFVTQSQSSQWCFSCVNINNVKLSPYANNSKRLCLEKCQHMQKNLPMCVQSFSGMTKTSMELISIK